MVIYFLLNSICTIYVACRNIACRPRSWRRKAPFNPVLTTTASPCYFIFKIFHGAYLRNCAAVYLVDLCQNLCSLRFLVDIVMTVSCGYIFM